MAEIHLKSGRKSVPVLIGSSSPEVFSVVATLEKKEGAPAKITGLPLKFDSPGKEDDSYRMVTTDAQGTAVSSIGGITAEDNGKTVRARVDVDALCPDKDRRGFFKAMIKKLSIPETNIRINTFEDTDTYLWHREFEGRDILIAAAYKSRNSMGEWAKIHDELLNHFKGIGGNAKRLKTGSDLKHIIDISRDPNGMWPADGMTDTDIVLLAVADGKFNKRDNPKNPFGEDAQFAGEIRTIAFKNSKPYFSDRYRGATGWNPMGEEMCMDVLALHVFKRWKTKYLKHISDE
jgi:hypothetical protein